MIYNKFGKQIGNWRFQDGRTLFFDQQGDQLKLVPGTTWVEIVDSLAKLSELAE